MGVTSKTFLASDSCAPRDEGIEMTLALWAEHASWLARRLRVVHLILHVSTGRDRQRFWQATEFLIYRTPLRS